MNSKKYRKAFWAVLSFAVVLASVPFSGVAFAQSECTYIDGGDGSYAEGEDCGHEHDDGCGDGCGWMEEGQSGSVNGHDDDCGYPDEGACGLGQDEAGGRIETETGAEADGQGQDGPIGSPERAEKGTALPDEMNAAVDGASEALAALGTEDSGIEPMADSVWDGSMPPAAVADGDTITVSGTPSGVLTVPAGAAVTIEGMVTGATAGIALDIGAGATVQWNAAFQGSSASYLISINGSGGFVAGPYTIANLGAGGSINIVGAGTAVTVGGGAIAASGSGGNAILVSADSATVNVDSGGRVESLDGNGNAAIQVGSGSNNNIQDAVINVNGGSVVSVGAGYAINDGAGTDVVANNTKIAVSGGAVTAGTACAVHSTGTGSAVTVSGGSVTNAAGNNANPAIYMNAGSGDNVSISGGTVQSASNAGYAIQTTGNAAVSGGLVTAVNGRAINLVGMASMAAVSGGTVQTTGTGTAISTATTNADTVAGASVAVAGGTVASANGFAINVTGADSSVTVSGGTVSAASTATANHAINAIGIDASIKVSGGLVSAVAGNAVNATGAAANAAVVVGEYGKVSSQTGRAIQSLGAGSTVTVNGTTGSGPGGQVWVLTAGNAIRSSGSVVLNGGFVFAYGANASSVISAAPVVPGGSSALVVAWNQAAGRTQYPQGNLPPSHEDLSLAWNGTFPTNLWWGDNSELKGGIQYANGPATTGFFPVPGVTIARDYGLIFDSLTGNMYMNVDETGVPSATNYQVFPLSYASAWSGVPGVLTLVNFSWNTNAPVALTIVNGPAAINYTGANTIASHTTQQTTEAGMSAGIYGGDLAIGGSGTLRTAGSEAAGALPSYGIACGGLSYNNGLLESRGATDAFKTDGFTNNAAAYGWWANASNADPGGPGVVYAFGAPAPYNAPYGYSAGAHKYVKISSGSLAVIDNVTVSGTMGEPLAVQTATIKLYGATKNGSGLSAADVSDWFADLPAGISVAASCAAYGDTLALTFSGTPAEGSSSVFDIAILGGTLAGIADSLNVAPNPGARFNIIGVYDLFVIAGKGGSVSGTASGRYINGTPVNVRATAAPGYYFTGWAVSGAGVRGGARSNPAMFSMPADQVVLTAGFARDLFKLTVVNGSGSGSYASGAAVEIAAGKAPSGQVFDHWESSNGGTFANAAAAATTFTMPAKNVAVEAVYREKPVPQPFDTDKTDGSENGSQPSGNGSAGPAGPAGPAGSAVRTGDYSHMASWWASLAASALCVFYISKRRRRPGTADGKTGSPLLQ